MATNATTTTRLSHRHQPSNTSFSSASSSSSSTRPALPQILSNSATNAVNFTRSATSTSRRVRSHWFTHFVLNWRQSSRSSKLHLGFTMTLVGIQLITSIGVLLVSWEMYCDRPLRVFVSVYILRLVVTAPINIYLHLAPRRRSTYAVSPRTSARSELSEAYALSERNRPVSFPPPVTTNNNHTHYPAFVAPVQHLSAPDVSLQQMDNNTFRLLIDRAKSALDVFAVLWFIIGNYMIFSSTTCSDTAIPLYYLSLAIIVYGYMMLSVPIFLCTSVIFCLPCVLVGMRLLHVDEGVDMGGATSEEIALIPVYRFKANNTAMSPSPSLPEDIVMIDLSKADQYHERKQGMFDKLWPYLGLSDPPCEKEVELEFLEILDAQDQVCAICLSKYEDGDILCKLCVRT
ncbi:hypothetical protein G6F56_009998 [Rhizopus delemar]|nr:hypothetical protein G6F56_009998 [Rhizopus delemar]